MSNLAETARKAIEETMEELRAKIAGERAAAEKRNELVREAMEWDTVPDDISDEEVTAIIFTTQVDPFAASGFKLPFLEDFKKFMTDMKEKDLMRLLRVAMPVQEMLKNPPVEPAFPRIELIAVPPAEDDESGEWVLIAAPLQVGEDYSVSLPQQSPCDMSMTLEVAPRPDESLTHTFNVPGVFIAAGSPAKPLVLAYKPDGDGPKTMLLNGRTSANGVVEHQIIANETFHVGEEPPAMMGGFMLPGLNIQP